MDNYDDRDRRVTDTNKASTATGAARANASGQNPSSPPASKDETDRDAPPDTKAESPGFSAFRLWVNAKLRAKEGIITINHAEKEMIVEELLHNGQLRLTYEGQFYLVPLGGDIIPALLTQILE